MTADSGRTNIQTHALLPLISFVLFLKHAGALVVP